VHSLINCNNVYKVIICNVVTVMNLDINSGLIAHMTRGIQCLSCLEITTSRNGRS
jgi:hypothetical protein